LFRIPLAALLALAAWPALAADAAAATAAAPPPQGLETVDFFRESKFEEAQISPDGRYLALLVAEGKGSKLGFIELATMKGVAAYNIDGNREYIESFHWANSRQVVFATAQRHGPLSEVLLTGRLMVACVDRCPLRELDSPELFVDRIRDNPDEILVQWDGTIFRENIQTGRVHQVLDLPYQLTTVVADSKGKVRMISGQKKADEISSVWDDKADDWREVWRGPALGAAFRPLAMSADNQHAYFLADLDAATRGIYQVEPATQERKLLLRDAQVDPAAVITVPGSDEPAGAIYIPDYPVYRFFDDNSPTARSYAALRKAFPGANVFITSSSDDGKLAVVAVTSDTHPSAYFLLDIARSQVSPLFESRPWLDPARMSEMSAIRIKARDGLELNGYLTLPRGAGEKNLPLVVLPHGGPHGVRDVWGFDPEVQFLAYHGYAVLQINFRGSAGYGRDFQRRGFLHWGTTMQDDITDATHWVIQQGIADPRRICIYGASYGGYAAMMGVINEPDLYRCAIGYAGAYDLTVQKRDSDTADTREGRVLLKDLLGDDKDDLKARSPVYHVDRIKVPVLLAHGEDDERVPFKNFEEMVEALKKAGKSYETLVKPYEGHGFYKVENQVELYDRIVAFLDRNIGPQAAAAPAPAH
jgi:dipeptidyl aminopeptidase/acylaminoacyl peptidase